MEQALQNIFAEPTPSTRYVEITKKTSSSKYVTVDVYGRKWPAESQTLWNVGDYVVIQFGRIVGRTQKLSDPVNYEV